MRLARLWRRTSVRLALVFSLMVAATLAVAGLVAYEMIEGQVSRQQDQALLGTFSGLEQEFRDNGLDGLRASVAARLAVAPPGTVLIQLRDAQGRVLAGSARALDVPEGWSDLPPGPQQRPFRLYRAPVGDADLVVGGDTMSQHQVADIVTGAFGWTAAMVALMALGGGVLLGLRVQSVVDRVERTMDRVAGGELSARIPLRGQPDDLERLADSINGALARLEGLVEGMRQVSSDIAHDLRTPLNRLRMRIEAMTLAAGEEGPLAEELAAALEESDQLDATFAALLRIAQIEAGARRDRFAPVDLSGVMARIAEAYEGVAEDSGMRLTLDAPAPATVGGDRELLTQMLANLVENAIRHCPPGATVACAVGMRDGAVEATVTDDGPGIPEDQHGHVLRRFGRLERSRTTPGSGLGLALVKAVADLHGAKLSLEDAGPGLRVRLRVPAA